MVPRCAEDLQKAKKYGSMIFADALSHLSTELVSFLARRPTRVAQW